MVLFRSVQICRCDDSLRVIFCDIVQVILVPCGLAIKSMKKPDPAIAGLSMPSLLWDLDVTTPDGMRC